MVRIACLFALFALPVLAGGGPETTLVVVNADSAVSRLVANEYVEARGIPRNHVVSLNGIPPHGIIRLDRFLEMIWTPIAAKMQQEGLEGHIDLITYSVDFPFGVDFKERIGDRGNPQVGTRASLTGVTYLISMVLAGEDFWELQCNDYYGLDLSARNQPRRATAEETEHYQKAMTALQGKQLEEARTHFAALLATYSEAPQPWYNYACVLALLGKKDEAMAALVRSAETGFTGKAHASADPDLASLRQRSDFKAVLDRMGQWAPKLMAAEGYSSAERGGYLSTQLGYTGRWGNSVDEVRAALARSVASDGTHPDGTVYILRNSNVRSTAREPFFLGLQQTLKDLGRKVEQLDGVLPEGESDVLGAVIGSANFDWAKSGSQMVPGAIVEHLTSNGGDFAHGNQTKLSELIRHGAAGSSGTVAEPYAIHQKFPNPLIHAFYAEGLSLAEAFYRTVHGPYQLMVAGDGLARPFANFEGITVKAPPAPWSGEVSLVAEGARGRIELWIDGKFMGESLTVDTTRLEDGHHEVRVVSVSNDKAATRSGKSIEAVVQNGTASAEAKTKAQVTFGEPIVIETTAPSGTITLDSSLLGPGPLTLRPRLRLADGSDYIAAPMEVMVEMPAALPEPKATDAPRLPGLRATLLEAGGPRDTVLGAKIGPFEARRVELTGEIEAPTEGLYQLQLSPRGSISVRIAGRMLCENAKGDLLLPVHLAKGWHELHMDYEPAGAAKLELLWGGAVVLAEPALRHARGSALKETPTVELEEGATRITFKRATPKLVAFALFSEEAGKDLPAAWTVETASGSKWKAVAGVTVTPGPGYLLLQFPLLKSKRVRLVPTGVAPAVRVMSIGLD